MAEFVWNAVTDTVGYPTHSDSSLIRAVGHAESRQEAFMTTINERSSAANVLDLFDSAGREGHRYSIDVESYTPSYAVLRLAGELDMGQRVELVHALDRLLLVGTDIHVDLSGVTFMSSGVANAVVDAAGRGNNRIRLFAPTRAVSMIFQALGASELIAGVATSTADALGA
ncbi:hypothetical protein G418_02071 [Rhodococcus qingshengii BKS 20-40]|nr:hypothetical protein G418_02071 [Rhodococcus qingshengii BKS 20-40]